MAVSFGDASDDEALTFLGERSLKARSKRQTLKSPVGSTGLSSGMALALFVAGEHAQQLEQAQEQVIDRHE